MTDGGLVSVQYEKLPQGEDLLLSEWVGEPEFIALDSSVPEALTDGGNLTVSEHYIGVFPNTERPFKLFDRATGKFLCNVGNIGRGPGEYNRISFAQIDETGGKIWISTLYDNKIHTYDLSTGRFLEDLPLAYEAEGNPNQGYNFMVDGSAQTVTIATTPFDDGCPVIAWCQDYVLVNISQIKMVTSRNTGSGASISLETDLLPAIVLDRRTGKVSRRTVIDDILTMDETSPSFKCGYLAESYSPEYFIEISAKALEEGNLSNAARKRISTILENLSEEDNNVILLAPIK